MNETKSTIVIKVHAGIGFEDLLPGSSVENPVDMEVDSDTSLDAVAQLAGLQPDDRYMIALNGTVVVKGERDSIQLAAGDNVEILPPLSGG